MNDDAKQQNESAYNIRHAILSCIRTLKIEKSKCESGEWDDLIDEACKDFSDYMLDICGEMKVEPELDIKPEYEFLTGHQLGLNKEDYYV